MRIVVFAGGTGSVALQRGLYDALDTCLDGIDTKIIVNAYDNGLSTGAVRRVMQGQILGPSDVRKNQTTRLQLQDPSSPWLKFLGVRFTAGAQSPIAICEASIRELEAMLPTTELENCGKTLRSALKVFFNSPLAGEIDYSEFSLANIIYAGLARDNENSLRAAARIMAGLLHLPDNVLLNDDTSLFLGAITRSGRRVPDEGEIVSWGNEGDPFVDIFFTDTKGNDAQPVLCLEAWRAILEADLILLSSGTQWSSLIPTYASRGFREAIQQSHARLLMIMNRIPDRDSPGQSASDILQVLVPRYFDPGRLCIIADSSGHSMMRELTSAALHKVASFVATDLSTSDGAIRVHDSTKLARAVGRAMFKEYLDSDLYLFDYDDTLIGRDAKFPSSSQFNLSAITKLNSVSNVALCTGNTIRAVNLEVREPSAGDLSRGLGKPLLVFADGGVNEYSYSFEPHSVQSPNGREAARCIAPEAHLPSTGHHSAQQIVARLVRAGIPPSIIDVRGNAVIAIRPVPPRDRNAVLSLVAFIIHGSGLEVRECGRTTVEICRPMLSKRVALSYVLINSKKQLRITYVGDELNSGNDSDVMSLATERPELRCLHVSSPAATAFFMSTLITYLDSNVKH